MRAYLGIATAALVLSLAPAYAKGKNGECKRHTECWMKQHGPQTGLKPAIKNQVCFNFTQPKPGEVVLFLYSSYDHVTKTGTVLRKLKRQSGTRGKFCPGAESYVSKTVWAILCNDDAHDERGVPSITRGLATGEVNMCLHGKDQCNAMGYQ